MVLPEFDCEQKAQRLTLEVGRIAVFILTLVLATVAYAQSWQAGEKPWEGKQYGYFAQEEPLRELLYDFASSVSVPTIVSPNINTTVSGSFPVVSANEFLVRITETYDLSWVYDGTTLYVYNISEIERKTLDLPYTLAEKFRGQLKSLALQGAPLSWDLFPAQNTVHVSGPPRFVELVSETVAWAIKKQASEVGDESYSVRVFHIKYGYVDGANSVSSKRGKVTSLAEMLSRIMNVSHINKVTNDASPSRKLRGTGLVPDDQPPQPSTITSSTSKQARKSVAYIASAPRLNVIIVRDIESRMPTYEQLIRQLDIPQDQIQIQVTILDIRDTDAQSLGFNWRGSEQRGDINFSINEDVSMAMSAATVGRVIAQISALQEKGKSRVVSRPSVLTLDNHEALFQSNQTFYVRLGADEAVDLVPVSYGSVLRVRPHLIYEPEERKIYLSVHVEDGSRGISSEAVAGVPEVSRTVIQTQAIIRENQSLLIGGYSIRERIDSSRRIPLLGHIPLLGRLFSWKQENNLLYDRYFVITPTIVDATIEYNLHTGFDDIDSGHTKVLHGKGHSADVRQTMNKEESRQERAQGEEYGDRKATSNAQGQGRVR